jgi:hypothetical protein
MLVAVTAEITGGLFSVVNVALGDITELPDEFADHAA